MNNRKNYQLSPADKNRLQLRLAYLIYEMGMTRRGAARLLHINENTARNWLSSFAANDEESTKAVMRDKDSLNAFAARVQKKWPGNWPVVEEMIKDFIRVH